jgi:hypothetical protein
MLPPHAMLVCSALSASPGASDDMAAEARSVGPRKTLYRPLPGQVMRRERKIESVRLEPCVLAPRIHKWRSNNEVVLTLGSRARSSSSQHNRSANSLQIICAPPSALIPLALSVVGGLPRALCSRAHPLRTQTASQDAISDAGWSKWRDSRQMKLPGRPTRLLPSLLLLSPGAHGSAAECSQGRSDQGAMRGGAGTQMALLGQPTHGVL